MMASGSAVQTKGLGLWLCSARYRLIAAWRSTSEWNTPRCRRRRVSLAKKPSTALSQEAEVGVKWKVQRGWRASQARTLGCLWLPYLSSTTWTRTRHHRARDRRLAGLASLVAQQAVDARLHEAPLPAPDRGLGHAGAAHDLRRAAAFGRGQDDPCPPDMLLGAIPIGQNSFQPLPVTRPEPDFDIASHVRSIQQTPDQGNPPFRSDH